MNKLICAVAMLVVLVLPGLVRANDPVVRTRERVVVRQQIAPVVVRQRIVIRQPLFIPPVVVRQDVFSSPVLFQGSSYGSSFGSYGYSRAAFAPAIFPSQSFVAVQFSVPVQFNVPVQFSVPAVGIQQLSTGGGYGGGCGR